MNPDPFGRERAANREQITEATDAAEVTADEWRELMDARYRRVTKLLIVMLALGVIAFCLGGLWLRAQQGDLTAQQGALTKQGEATSQLAKANAQNLATITRLRARAADESCKRSEQQEKIAVQSIVRTYEFLDRLSASAADEPITQAIVRQLPTSYKEARASKAPSYCNSKGVGLSESKKNAPTLPAFRSFDYLLTR